MQQKDEKGAPAQAQQGGEARGGEQRAQKEDQDKGQQKGSAQKSAEPKEKSTKGAGQGDAKTKPGKDSAQSEPKDKASKRAAQPESKEKSTKDTAQTPSKDKGSKGAAQIEPKDKSTKGTAQTPSKDQSGKGTASDTSKGGQTAPKSTDAGKSTSGGARVQLSEQQRGNIGATFTKETRLNRVTNVNFSINVGTRVPRSVRLVVLPASVIAIVPEYRSYHYFVVNEQICIVEPTTYEIVEVIQVSSQTARAGGSATLVLTEEERAILLSEIDLSGGSTLALGSLSEGAEVPRDVELRVFTDTIVQKVPKVRDFKFFTAENRLAIVDPQGAKVQLMIEGRR
jgi:hypothetical protein